MNAFENKKVMVLGMARSGIAAARMLIDQGAEVWACDRRAKESFEGALDDIEAAGAHLLLDEAHPEAHLEGMDMLVVSPGIRIEHPAIEQARALGIEVLGEIEAAYRASRGTLMAITGTNGKTTTVTLLGEIMAAAGNRTHVVGNIGTPYSSVVTGMRDTDVTVCEISSFMMETSDRFHPAYCAVLNISEDHMDRHHTMERYIALKERVFERCEGEDVLVLNWDDPIVRDMAHRAHCRVMGFSVAEPVHEGTFVEDGYVVYREKGVTTRVLHPDEIYIPGEHNLKNALAATAMAMASGVSADVVAQVLRTFKGVEHRIEYVRTLEGTRFYNDSKGTNVDSSIQAVRAMKRPTVLILGGYDKHCDFSPLVEEILKAPIEWIVLIGVTADQIAATLEKYGYTAYEHCGTDFERAVARSYERAKGARDVLFSPSCASFDMFSDYEQRGRIFKALVNHLI